MRSIKKAITSSLVNTVHNSLAHVGIGLDVQNSIKFRDIRIMFSCDIKQKLPNTTILPHPVGIVISDTAKVGENVRIYQNVTIGWTRGAKTETAATIGDNVTIYSGAAIVGDVNIGQGAVIGSNAVVLDDVYEGTTVVGVPAERV